MKTQQLWFREPFTIDIRDKDLPDLEPDQLLVCSRYSAISAGTELLAYTGRLPQDLPLDMTLGEFKDQPVRYPMRYGYATVGIVEDVGTQIDSSLVGMPVFAYQPHARHFITTADQLIPLPDDADPVAASFIASMETAVNLVLDGRPLFGERVAVLGQGVVGLLVTGLLAAFPLEVICAADRFERRRAASGQMGADEAFDPEDEEDLARLRQTLSLGASHGGADLVYELTGAPEALDLAIELCGFGSRIVVGSWYGTKSADLHLGSNFHRDRIKIVSSQVSTIAPELSGRWNRFRRFEAAWTMIDMLSPEQLITHRIPFRRAAEAYQILTDSPQDVLQAVLVYEDD